MNLLLWQSLASMGMDVSMTPITTDMLLMLEPNQKTSYYQRKIQFVVFKKNKEMVLSWDMLDFYKIRLPALLMTEYGDSNIKAQGFINALCFQLNKIESGVNGFRIELEPLDRLDQSVGLNKNWYCQ